MYSWEGLDIVSAVAWSKRSYYHVFPTLGLRTMTIVSTIHLAFDYDVGVLLGSRSRFECL